MLSLPSFFSPAILSLAVNSGASPPVAPAALSVVCTVPLSSVSESHLFGLPWEAAPDDDADDDDLGVPMGGSGGAYGNRALVASLCASLAAKDLGLLLSSSHNLDTGKPTPFRCLYLAQPAALEAAGSGRGDAPSGEEEEGGAATTKPAAAVCVPKLLVKRIAAREEVLPLGADGAAACGGGGGCAPPNEALLAETSASLASWPAAAYEPRQHERGCAKVLSALLAKSMALPAPASHGRHHARA